jgi:hypothetical protein
MVTRKEKAMPIQPFRQRVYQKLGQRAGAALDLIDALTVAGRVSSPVALSEAGPFRRQSSSGYDVLNHGALSEVELAEVLYEHQPVERERIAGYEVYAVDATSNERAEAETAAERGYLKSDAKAAAKVGYKFSWLVRLVGGRTSWVAPQDVQRIKPASSEGATAAEPVKALDQRSTQPKVVVADSRYASVVFLAVFRVTQTLAVLVRLRNHQVLYEQPHPKPQGRKGAPRKHGAKFKLANPGREPDRHQTITRLGQQVRLRAWHKLHLYKLPTLVGLVLCVECLRPDGRRRFRYPLWLLWSGSTEVALADLARMYLWRFAIEPAFRFLKQHLGLNANQATTLTRIDTWMWLWALAYPQLLLMRADVEADRPAWQRLPALGQPSPLTPGLVQRRSLFAQARHPGPAPQTLRKRHWPASGLLASPPSPLQGRSQDKKTSQNTPKTGRLTFF